MKHKAPNPNAAVINNRPKILFFDIETAGPASNRADLAFVVVFGYKWAHESQAKSISIDSQSLKKFDDGRLLQSMREVFEQADLIVAHYGSIFDRRFLQGRLLVHGMAPLPHTPIRDTCIMARKLAHFSSNRLGYLAKILALDHRKMDNGWPGEWFKVLAGDMQAVRKMAKYCEGDVLALEALYNRLAPFDHNHPYLFGRERCAACGSDHVQYRGTQFVLGKRRRRFQCQECAKWGSTKQQC